MDWTVQDERTGCHDSSFVTRTRKRTRKTNSKVIVDAQEAQGKAAARMEAEKRKAAVEAANPETAAVAEVEVAAKAGAADEAIDLVVAGANGHNCHHPQRISQFVSFIFIFFI